MRFLNKPKNIPWRQLIVLFLITVTIYSCRKHDDDSPDTDHKTLVSYQKISTVTAQSIDAGFLLLSVLYPDIAGLNLSNLTDVDIYKVKYKTSLANKEIIASGIACIPKKTGSYPVLSFQNGTNTSNKNAPSENISDPQFAILQQLSGAGYIVTIPDYVGFGESNSILHPYYHRQSSDASVINLINAAQELIKDIQGVTTNGKLFMLGYSQGGWATLSAFKTLEESNPTGLEPVAASCGAGAYDLPVVASHILGLQTYPSPAYLPYFIESHRRNELLNTDLKTYFNNPYADKIPGLFNGQTYIGTINAALNDTISRLMTSDMIQGFAADSKFEALREELLKNSVEAWNVKGKLLFIHGNNDDTVPVFESENIVSDFRALGLTENQVNLVLLEGINHSSGVLPWAVKSLVWLDGMK